MANQNIISIILKAFGANETAAEIKKPVDACEQLSQTIQDVQRKFTTFIATVYSLRKAWEYADMAAQFQEQKASLNALAAQYNTTANEIIASVRDASHGMVSLSEAAGVSAKAMMMGLNPEQLARFMRIVEATTNVTGQRIGQAFEAITEAVSAGNERALKQMGIIVDMQGAYKRYAESAGVLTNELSEQERQQIAVNTVLEHGSDIMNRLGDSTDSVSDKMERFRVMVQDIKIYFGDVIIRTGAGLLGMFHAVAMGLVEMAEALVRPFALIEKGLNMIGVKSGVMSDFAERLRNANAELYKDMKEVFSVMTASAQEAATAQKGVMGSMDAAVSEHTGKNLNERRKWMEWEWQYADTVDKAGQEILDNLEKRDQAAREHARTLQAARESEIQLRLKEIDLSEQEFGISRADATQRRVELYEELKSIQEAYLANLDKEKDPASWYAQINAITETREALINLNLELEKQTGTFAEGAKYGFQEYMHNAKTAFEYGTDMAAASAGAMEGLFASISFDAMQGKLKTLGDYFRDFMESIQQAISQMLAQLVVQGIMSGVSGAFAPQAQVVVHSGGYIPRFHVGGLARDEIPAILQRGEYVVSRKGVEMLDRINAGNPYDNKENIIVQQTIQINASTIDGRDTDRFFRENEGRIQEMVARGIRNSRSFAKKMKDI